MLLLKKEKIPFLVGGAFALRVHAGILRDTKDFDLMMPESAVPAALEVFRRAGFRAEMAFSHWLAKVHHGELFIDLIFNSGNGLCPVDEQWMRAARVRKVLGVPAKLCPPEEMIWQKAFIMERERFDGADVLHLLLSCSAVLNWDRLIERFAGHWQVLLAHLLLFQYVYPSHRNEIPSAVLQTLHQRSGEIVTRNRKKEKLCRGTLLSREQYLPDIDRWNYADARRKGSCSISAEQIEAWTSAINPAQFRT